MYSQDVIRLIQDADIAAGEAGTLDGKANAKALTALAAAVYYAANNASISVSLDTGYNGALAIQGDVMVRAPGAY